MINFFIFAIVILLAVICYTDIRYRLITNKIVLCLSVVILPFAWLQYAEIYILNAVITFVIGLLLFRCRVIGGGDVKLIAVLMLAVPASQVVMFLFLTSFFGLLIIIFGWLFFRQNIRTQGLPYGVAISLGFLLTVFF